MGDYTIDQTEPLDVTGLETRQDGDAVWYICPVCKADIRIGPEYKGPRSIAHRLMHVYPCAFIEERIRVGSKKGLVKLTEMVKQANEWMENATAIAIREGRIRQSNS